MINDEILVTVVIPTFNRAKLVVNAINSVINQTYQNIEIIVVDDGSTDDTQKAVTNINDNRIKYIFQEFSNGNVARNNGIKHANGEYIALLDDDDTWHPSKLEIQLREMVENDAKVSFTGMKVFSASGKYKEDTSKENPNGYLDLETTLCSRLTTASLMVKKEVFDLYKFDERIEMWQELEWAVRVAQKYDFWYVAQPLMQHNLLKKSITAASSMNKFLAMLDIFTSEHKEVIDRFPRLKAKILKSIIQRKSISGYDVTQECKQLKKCDKTLKSRLIVFLNDVGLLRCFIKIYRKVKYDFN